MNRFTLLLNASNISSYPVYPYAFIQLPAVARREGIEVICRDLLGIPKYEWAGIIRSSIEEYHPEIVLITLRNTDSLTAENYEKKQAEDGESQAYFPIEDTRALIAVIREVSNLKIAIGGFGFSVMPEDLMHYLRPDYGVFGDADSFFHYFESILAGNPHNVPNLLYFEGERLVSNPRQYFPPFSGTEYSPQVIAAMMAFYEKFPKPGFEGAPVEIIRGCPHRCIFCSEPHVKGRQVRYRDLTAVMADIEILAAQGITKIYMINSELNPEGNNYALELADHILAFNKRQPPERQISWFGPNYLLQFNLDEFERLHRSGFTGGWFDITALDDDNARAMGTPYRNSSLLNYLKDYAVFESTKQTMPESGSDTAQDLREFQADVQLERPKFRWTMMLGNPATTMGTIRNTLRVANQEGLAQQFSSCYITPNIRVFDYENPDQQLLAITYSINTHLERTGYQQILPSFAYAPALLDVFNSESEIIRLFKHIQETYLSTRYRKSRDWQNFIRGNATLEQLGEWLTASLKLRALHPPAAFGSSVDVLSTTDLQLFFAEGTAGEVQARLESRAEETIDWLLEDCMGAFPGLMESMGLPGSKESLEGLTPYELAVVVYQRWSTWEQFEDELVNRLKSSQKNMEAAFVRFCLKALLHKFNLILDPKYKALFVENAQAA